ncbi:MAG: DUF2203 domain-containing protein [Chlorobi bacterium]|nr:DUF2203 domain-containing protein [Chlorobiota bacterium]
MSYYYKKHFTPEEANKTLPLVKQIARDILTHGFEIKAVADSLNNDVEQMKEDERIAKLSKKIRGFIEELEELGCYYNDWNFTIGLVDFPAIIDGEEVYLCWKSDEEEVKYFHGLEEGYAGRKLISEAFSTSV